jgi:dTDP-4-dehydrorhamnose reductase
MDVYRSIVITGGGGMLAHSLRDALQARGLDPIAVGRSECDVASAHDVSRLFQRHRPSLLLNCAAHTAVDLCEDEPARANAINGEGPGHLARMACEYGTCLTHFSTDFVFHGQNDRPYRPDDPPAPISTYGASKLLGETKVREANPRGWLILRTAWLFGRYGNCFPKTIIKLAQAGRPLRVVNDQIGSPTSTVDLAEATLRLIDQKATGLFHVTNAGVTSWYDFAAEILRQFGLAADLAPVTTDEWVRMRPKQAKRPAYSGLDCSAYESLTGQVLRGWKEALAAYQESVGDATALVQS